VRRKIVDVGASLPDYRDIIIGVVKDRLSLTGTGKPFPLAADRKRALITRPGRASQA